MADVTPTQAIVLDGKVRQLILGEAVTVIGQLLTYDSITGSFLLAGARDTTLKSVVYSMALETGIKDDTIRVLMPGGVVDLGVVLSQGAALYLSPTPGRISNTYADLLTGDHVSSLGVAQTTSQLLFQVFNSRVAIP